MEKIEQTEDAIGEDGRVTDEIIVADSVSDSIVVLSSEFDITLLGATREGVFQQLLFGAIPEEVGQRADGIVTMAKRNLGLASRLSRWFRRERHH